MDGIAHTGPVIANVGQARFANGFVQAVFSQMSRKFVLAGLKLLKRHAPYAFGKRLTSAPASRHMGEDQSALMPPPTTPPVRHAGFCLNL